ncbi:hypothetical protein Tco_0144150 [Tanacetum coccineum]
MFGACVPHVLSTNRWQRHLGRTILLLRLHHPTALSPGYADYRLDHGRGPEEGSTDYPADGGDGDDEPSNDDDDTDYEDEEPFEDEDDDDEEEEHLAPADSLAIPIVYPVLLAGDTEAFETGESAPTPRSPQTKRGLPYYSPLPPPRISEIGESSTACAMRQPGTTLEADLRRDKVMETGYEITDTWDEIVEAMLEVAPTTLEGVNQRVTELATTVRQ